MVADQLTDLYGQPPGRRGREPPGRVPRHPKDDLAGTICRKLTAAVAERSTRPTASGTPGRSDGQIARDAALLLQRESPMIRPAAPPALLAQGARTCSTPDPPPGQTGLSSASITFPRRGASRRINPHEECHRTGDARPPRKGGASECARPRHGRHGRSRSRRAGENVSRSGGSLVNDRETLIEANGLRPQRSAPPLLLGAITELWVDYLTRVEALRVSIGLEAYAQRDPLVQYKCRASEMFQRLLEDIRGLVVGRCLPSSAAPAWKP